MADKLTPQQAQAVSDRGGELLVSAAAGSGKTKVLVDRLLSYLTDPMDPANLDAFLIITYTKAAASELRSKIASKLTERIAEEPENRHLQKQLQRLFLTKISTVHGFCADLLREYAYYLDVPSDFRVADENECRELRENVLTDLLERAYNQVSGDDDFRAFVDTQGLGRTDAMVPQIIERVFDAARCHLDPDGWLQKCVDYADSSKVQDASETIWGDYLIRDLHAYLDAEIRVLRQCANLAAERAGFERPAMVLRDTLYQLETLRGCCLWSDICKKRTIDYGRLTFPRKNPDPELAERIKAVRNACKKGLEKKLNSFVDDSEQILADLKETAAGTRGLVATVRQFAKEYAAAKRSRRVLDFGDLEHMTLDLLLGKSRSGPTVAAREIGRRFREIMVDEYQDSNGVQDAIFSALTGEKHNCFMVGDVKQSIYQFRLADPGIFLKKYNSYVSVKDSIAGQGRKVLLSHNFRSGGEIIDAVNDVFSVCMSHQVGGLCYGEEECLREGIPHEPLPSPGVELYTLEIREETYVEEAEFVAQKVQSMLRDGTLIRGDGCMRRVEPEDIVILLRSPGSVGGYFQHALEARGIRCNSGSGSDLLQTEEIATLRAFLQTIVNPRQDIPLIATMASPIFGFNADELAQIRSCKRKGFIYDALLDSDLPKVKEFLVILTTLRKEARMSTLTSLLERCFQLTRLDSVFGAMEAGDARQTNLQLFYQLAVDFEAGSLRDLGQFLEHLDALEGRGMVTTGSNPGGCVSIMSIHKSKGLEFPVVFLCGLSRSFNRESQNAQILCDRKLGLGLSVADTVNRVRYPSISKRAISVKMATESLSEEMRVLYVALTRARDRLIMTYAAKNLQSDLQNIALRLDFDHGDLLCRDAQCPGDWILLAAMLRMEAGSLHAIGGRPEKTRLGKYPWKICISEAPVACESSSYVEEETAEIPQNAEEALRRALLFRYPHIQATMAPSKQTATGRKGRVKDEEVAEKTPEPPMVTRSWRVPSFVDAEQSGKEYGNAIHAALQYIHYENCGTEELVNAEIERLVTEGFLTRKQGEMLNREKIARFFATPIGIKLRTGTPYLREFKFSILDSGAHYGDGLEDEQVLLQGVVDCALIEEDGITIIDFKTDNVTEATVENTAARYTPQLRTYGDALSRIYEMPVKAMYLYFFRLDQFVKI